VIISDRCRFIFVHIHKTAGDSITEALKPNLGKNDFVLRTDVQAWTLKYRIPDYARFEGLKKHTPALAIRQRLPADNWESYFKFAFVRHPVGRVLSLYHYAARKAEERKRLLPRNAWYLTPPGKRGDPLNWPSVRAFLATDSFSSFIRHPFLANEGGMRPQSDFLCDVDGTLLVDFVGRFEKLQEDFTTVQDRIGIPHKTLAWNNSSRNSAANWADLSTDDFRYLAEMFKADFARFDYEVP
jgi:hypothetical protein